MKKKNTAGFCGIFCDACPLFQEEKCTGCKSPRITHYAKNNPKWECKIRKCASKKKNTKFCCDCSDYPCSEFIKLRNRHLKEKKYQYLHDLFYNLTTILFIGSKKWIEEQDKIWTCPKCGGRIIFLKNECVDCGFKVSSVYRTYVKETNYKIPDIE